MCGLFGWSAKPGRLTGQQKTVLGAVLAGANDQRGGDSWGVYLPGSDTLTRGLGAMVPSGVLATMRWADTVLGHTRKATQGAKVIDNAHPFRVGSLVGCHNGVISNHHELNLKHGRTFPVDSMHLLAHIDERKKLKELQGWGAVVYYSTKTRGVYLGRFQGGRLHIGWIGDGVIWSSDEADLGLACQAIGEREESYTVADSHLYAIEGHELKDLGKLLKVSNGRGAVYWWGDLDGTWENRSRRSWFRGHCPPVAYTPTEEVWTCDYCGRETLCHEVAGSDGMVCASCERALLSS